MAEAARAQPTTEAEPPRTGAACTGADGAHTGDGQVCTVGFCPICLAVTAVQPLKPEAIEHLLNAGRSSCSR